MGAMALVVDQRGARLDAGNHDTIIVTSADGHRERVGIRSLGAVVLNGDVTLSTNTLRKLAANGVAVTLLPVRGLSASVGFTALPERATHLRHAQHISYAQPSARLALACTVVQNKLRAQQEAIAERESDFDLSLAVSAAENATSISQLMGVEGAAAAAYFERLESYVPREFDFSGRNRRPARDPVNAMMSLGYTLAQSTVAQLALRSGLDLFVGFLHGIRHQRQSFALDLLEPVRPVVDRWVLYAISGKGSFSPSDFATNDADGCRLLKEPRQRFYRRWFSEAQPEIGRAARPLLANLLRRLRHVSCPTVAIDNERVGDTVDLVVDR